MKVNGITATDYQALSDKSLVLQLQGTTVEGILAIDTKVLNILTDTGDLVDTFVGMQLLRVTLNVADGSFEVQLIPALDDVTEQTLSALAADNGKLFQELKTTKSQLEAAIQSNAMLEDCLVEMAGVVYA